MDKLILQASKRTVVGRKVKQLRVKGLLPANIYGKKIESIAISVDAKIFGSIFTKSGETGLIELTVEDKKHPVLVHKVQIHPLTQKLVHVDFFEVDLKEKVVTKVPVVLVGEAPAVKEKIGVLLTLLSEVEVEALPADLPDHIDADVSALSEIGQTLLVSALIVNNKIKIITDGSHDVVKVAPLVSKEAEKMAADAAAATAATAAAAAATAEAGKTAAADTKSPPESGPTAK